MSFFSDRQPGRPGLALFLNAGDPPLDVLVRGGTHGDRGTVGTTVSAIPAVVVAAPGLKTILDLPLVG